jgi:hypothetical protein
MNADSMEARYAVSIELRNLLRIRRSLNRIRRECMAGKGDRVIDTPRGKYTSRELLLMAEEAFTNSVQRVCRERRRLFCAAPPAMPKVGAGVSHGGTRALERGR